MKSFEEARGEVLGGLKAGLSQAAAARSAGVAPRTVEHWLTRGRREPDSAFASFVAAVEAVREPRAQLPSGDMAETELRAIVARLARGGNVAACRLMLELLRSEPKAPAADAPDDPLTAMDELAAARARRSA